MRCEECKNNTMEMLVQMYVEMHDIIPPSRILNETFFCINKYKLASTLVRVARLDAFNMKALWLLYICPLNRVRRRDLASLSVICLTRKVWMSIKVMLMSVFLTFQERRHHELHLSLGRSNS